MTGRDAEPAEVLRRWERSGGHWRVMSRTGAGLRVELITCTGDEVVDVLESDDAELVALIGDRRESDDA